MKILLFLLRVSRRVVTLAVIAGVVSGLSSAALIALIGMALSKRGTTSSALNIYYPVLCLVVLVTGVVSQALLVRLSQGAIFNLRMNLCRRILSAPLLKLEETGAPRLLASLTDDILSITNALLSIPPLCISIATVLICLVYLGWLSAALLLLVFVFMALGVFSYILLLKRGARYVKAAREQQNDLFDHFRGLTEGIKELKIHGERRANFLSQSLQPTADSLRRNNNVGMTIFAVANNWGQLLLFIFIGILLFVIPARGREATVLAEYTLILFYMMGPLSFILSVSSVMTRASVSLQQVEALGLSLANHPSESDAAAPPADDLELLELSGLTHAYHREGEDDSFILGPIDLSFRRGELVFLAGGNGSGKTTLAKLLVGLYTPEAGEIRSNGQVVTDERRDVHRQYFSVVFSDFYLFKSLLGLNAPDLDARASRYLAQFHLDRNVRVENGTLSTTALSQGQRKRLALLTAYLEDRQFYVFDEWASDQDPHFKEVFYYQLLPELKSRGKTVLVITHDEKYFHLADRVVKLDQGQIDYDRYASDSKEADARMTVT
jgi:putative ATP-binding cassette transporter